MPNLTLKIANDSDHAKEILRRLRVRVRASERDLQSKHKAWKEAEERVLAYLPEREVDAAKRVAREQQGVPEYTTVQIPYSYAVLMAAHTYLTSVFMGRSPTHQFTGRHGESQQQVQALEALIDYQTLVGRNLPTLYTWLYDAGKYGMGVMGVHWETRIDHVAMLLETSDVDEFGQPTGKNSKLLRTMPQTTFKGNRATNVQPWDFIWDTRFPVKLFQQGAYCGRRIVLDWNEIKRREALGYYTNTDKIGNSSDVMAQTVGSSQLDRPSTTDAAHYDTEFSFGEVAREGQHPSEMRGYELYVEIIPSEWGLGESQYPQKWIFTCTADFSTLIGVQPHGALHCMYPFSVLPLEAEGYGLTTRGMPEILNPIQNVIDWLINSHFYNVRAALNNRVVVDPSKVVMKDVVDHRPGGVIRLKPNAYGTDVRSAFSQFAVQDMTQGHLRDLQMMFGIGERTMGVNDQIMGMINGGGGRKTATEIRTSTSFGVNRLKTISEWFSIVGWDPYAQMLVQNTQQYYDADMKFKIAGDLIGSAGPNFIQVNPEAIGGFYDFVPVDGTLPIDRYAQGNMWRELFAQSRQFPQLMVGYDWVGIFEWVAQLMGLKNISRFKLQVAPDDMLNAAAQAGNVVPMGGRGPSSNSTSTTPPPKQGPGMGPSG